MNEEQDRTPEMPREQESRALEAAGVNGWGRAPRNRARQNTSNAAAASTAHIDAWVVLDLLVRRWRWLLAASSLCGLLFLLAGWVLIQPRFTATAILQRYETAIADDFFRTATPISPETFAGIIRSPELLRRVGDMVNPKVTPEKLKKSLRIEPEPESDLITVSLAATDPNYAVNLLNLYLNEAVNYTRELRAREAALLANTYLQNQVQHLDQEIQAVRRDFKSLPSTSELVSATNTLALLGRHTERLNKALDELGDLLTKYTEMHPAVKNKRAEIDRLRNSVAQESSHHSSPGLDLPSGLLHPQGAQGVNPDFDLITIKMRALEDARVQLSSRFHEARMYAENPPGNARVNTPASLQNVQQNWRWFKILALACFGLVLGLGAGATVVGVTEFMDRRLKTPDDVSRVTGLKVIAELGNLEDMDSEARSHWAFRTWTILQGRLSPSANHGLVCGITSSTAGEGRSTWISLLAEAASMSGFRVLTIATRPSPTHVELGQGNVSDFEPGGVEAVMENQNPTSLTASVLSAPAQVSEKLTGPDSQPMVHIPLPGWVWNLERRRQWREAINHWRRIDNLVIFVELPPAGTAEAVLLGSNLPNLLWLTNSGAADAALTREQLETLRHARCRLAGAVMNRQPYKPMRRRFPRWVGCGEDLRSIPTQFSNMS